MSPLYENPVVKSHIVWGKSLFPAQKHNSVFRSLNFRLLPWPPPEKCISNIFEKNNQPETHPHVVLSHFPLHTLSPLTLFGTSSRGESALPSLTPSRPFWHAPFMRRADSLEEGPGSPNCITQWEAVDFECLLLRALGQETHSSRKMDQRSGGKPSRLPKLHCNSDKVWNASLEAKVSLDTFGFVNAGCQHVPHNLPEETITWHSHRSATSATGANSSLIQLYAPYTHNCIPFAAWYVSPQR